jgi:hypothetical protein
MAKIEDDLLPYAYRPLEPGLLRYHVRRRRFFRLFFVALFLIALGLYAYWRFTTGGGDNEGLMGNGGMRQWMQRVWPKSLQSPTAAGDKEDIGNLLTENFKRDTMDPRKKATSPGNRSMADGLPAIKKEPSSMPFIEVPLEGKSGSGSKKGGVRQRSNASNSWQQLLAPIISPEMAEIFIRTGLSQLSQTFLAMLIPILESILPMRQIHRLQGTFRELAQKKLRLQEALVTSISPILQTATVALLLLLPEVGRDMLDAGESLLRSLTAFVNTADPSLLLHYGTDTAAEAVAYILGKTAA